MSAENTPQTARDRARKIPELISSGQLPNTKKAIIGYIEEVPELELSRPPQEFPLKVKGFIDSFIEGGDIWVQASRVRGNLKNEKRAEEAWQMLPQETQEETINLLQRLGLDASRTKPRELIIAFNTIQEKRLKTLEAALTLERQPERELTLKAEWESTEARVKKTRHWVSDKVSRVLAPVAIMITAPERIAASLVI